MEGISDIKIIGIDEKRPPVISSAPYIDLFFKLSHQAPSDWCNDFNVLMSKYPGSPKIKQKEGLYIESWVKTSDLIVDYLELLKKNVTLCSDMYIERIEQAARDTKSNDISGVAEDSQQGRLNKIIAGLVYDERDPVN
jgi:hypothetical protein